MERQMIYVMNHYSEKSVQHFFHVIHLLDEMAQRGVHIVLIIEKSDGTPLIDNKNIKVVVQKEKGKVKRALELLSLYKLYMKSGYNKIFIRISLNAAVIAIIAAKLYGGDTYFWQSGDNLTYDRQKKGMEKLKWLFTNYSKLLVIKYFITRFVTGPETMVDYYVDALGIKRDRMLLLYNDIDINRFTECNEAARTEVRNHLKLSQDSKIILFVHRLTPVKKFYLQIPYVIEEQALRDLNAYLVIIGDGPDREIIENLIQTSGFKDRILYLGSVPNKEIHKYYEGADIFINPSYSEGFPRVLIEAMACGLPVVATDVGGTKDIVGKLQKRFIVDKDDRGKFRNSVITILEDNLLYHNLSQENKKSVNQFSTEAVSEMYIKALF